MFKNPERLAVICVSKFILLLIITGLIAFMGLTQISRLESNIEDMDTQIYNYELLIEELSKPEEEPAEAPKEQPAGRITFASWYDYPLRGAPEYSKTHATAASPFYERGDTLVVTYRNKSVLVRVNDFGPDQSVFPERGIDLSSYAFAKLAPLSRGVIEVTVEPVDAGN